MLPSQLSITEARRLLPSLIHDLERNPDHVYRISMRKRVVAELKTPLMASKQGLAAKRLLSLAGKTGKARGAMRVSEDVDRYLY